MSNRIGVLFALLLAVLFIWQFASMYEVRPRVFSANGWSYKLVLTVPTSGLVRFDVNAYPEMRAGGADVVLTDLNGNVLRYAVWSGYLVPYSQLYNYRIFVDSPIFERMALAFHFSEGVGTYDANYNPLFAFRHGDRLVPVYYDNNIYVGVGGAESGTHLAVSVDVVDMNFFSGKLLGIDSPWSTRVVDIYEYTDRDSLVCESDGSACYFTTAGYSSGRDPCRFHKYVRNPDGTYSEAYYVDYGAFGTAKVLFLFEDSPDYVYMLRGTNPYYMAYDCSASDREDPSNYGCFNGVELLKISKSTGQIVGVEWSRPWHFSSRDLWDYITVRWYDGLAYDPETGRVYIPVRYDNFYGPDAWYLESPTNYIWVLDLRTGREYGIIEINYVALGIPVKLPARYPNVQNIRAIWLVGDDIYVLVDYTSVIDSARHGLLLVYDKDTLSFKYMLDFPVAGLVLGTVRDSAGFPIGITYYAGYDQYVRKTMVFGSSFVTWYELKDGLVDVPNPGLVFVPAGDGNYFVLVGSSPSRTGFVPKTLGYGWLKPDGTLYIFKKHTSVYAGAPQFPVVLPNGDVVVLNDISGGTDGSEYILYFPRSDMVSVDLNFGSVRYEYYYVPPADENVLHVMAYFPAPGTYYLYYGSDYSWYHLSPSGEASLVSVSVDGPYPVSIRPHAYSVSAHGDGSEYTVVAEYNSSEGPVYSQCFWNGSSMYQESPGVHVLSLVGASPVEYNLDCFALEVLELHLSNVLFFEENGDSPAVLSVTPAEVRVGDTVSLAYTGQSPVCYALWESGFRRLSYPTFVVDLPPGEYNIVCDSLGYSPAWATLVVLEAPSGAPPAAGAPPSRKPPVEGVVQPPSVAVQQASPLQAVPTWAWLLAVVVALYILYSLTRKR